MYIALYAGLLFILVLNSTVSITISGKLRRDRINSFCIVAFGIVTVMLYAASVDTIDSENYRVIFTYNKNLVFNSDPLFHRLVDLVKLFTEDYSIFRLVVGVIAVMPLIYLGSRKVVDNVSYFLLLCMLFPYFQNMVSLRNTVAMTFSLIGFYIWACYSHDFRHFCISSVCIGIASLFHITCVFNFIVIILCYIVDRIKPLQTLILLLVVSLVTTILTRMGLLSSFLNAVVATRNQSYLLGITNRGFGFLIICFFQLCITYLLYRKYADIDWKETQKKSFAKSIVVLNVALIVLVPLYSINILTFRMYRNLIPLLYAVLSFDDEKRNWSISFIAVAICVFLMLFDADGTQTIRTVFASNM